ncbi:cytosolic nucleoside diphosphate kinase, partial [Ramicandelaber brevisporus]
ESTFAMIKPDAVSAGYVDAILAKISARGYSIDNMHTINLSKKQAGQFYAEHAERSFFGELVDFITSGPVVALKLSGRDAIAGWREMIGPTNHESALNTRPNSIRALYGASTQSNAVHGSDSTASAEREIAFFFEP